MTRRGHPSATGPKHIRITFHGTPEQHQRLKIRAAELRTDVSAILRELIDDYLKRTERRDRS
jgi:hypothetical protein